MSFQIYNYLTRVFSLKRSNRSCLCTIILIFITNLYVSLVSASLRPLPLAQFATLATQHVNSTGGVYDLRVQDWALRVTSCKRTDRESLSPRHDTRSKSQFVKGLGAQDASHLNSNSASTSPVSTPTFSEARAQDSGDQLTRCSVRRRRCFLHRFGWCPGFYTQEPIAWRPPPRGDKDCKINSKGEECNGVGVCNYDFGRCECPAAWRGPGCEERVRQRCKFGPGSVTGAAMMASEKEALGQKSGPDGASSSLVPLSEQVFDSEDPNHWLRYMIPGGEWSASRCSGYCDDMLGLCFCGMGPNRYRPPPPGAPLGSIGTGRLLGHNCKPSTSISGTKLEWGTMTWDQLYGPDGYCMRSANGTYQPLDNICICDLHTRHGPFCGEVNEASCPNGCAGRGECLLGFCKCHKGWYGTDCSRLRAGLPEDTAEREALLAARPWIRAVIEVVAATVDPATVSSSLPAMGAEVDHEGTAQEISRRTVLARQAATSAPGRWAGSGADEVHDADDRDNESARRVGGGRVAVDVPDSREVRSAEKTRGGHPLPSPLHHRHHPHGIHGDQVVQTPRSRRGADPLVSKPEEPAASQLYDIDEVLVSLPGARDEEKIPKGPDSVSPAGRGQVPASAVSRSLRQSSSSAANEGPRVAADPSFSSSTSSSVSGNGSSRGFGSVNGGEDSATGSGGRLRPLIYVYDLAEFSSVFMQRSFGSTRCVWRHFSSANNTSFSSSVYDIESYMHDMLLVSEHRTFDPEEADFFYVPVYLACFFMPVLNWAELPSYAPHASSNRALHGTYMMAALLEHLKKNFPFWERRKGRDHIFLTTVDEGACYVPTELYRQSIFLTSWGRLDRQHVSGTGYSRDNYSDVNTLGDPLEWQAIFSGHPCYDPIKDLVIPSFKSVEHYRGSPLAGYPPLKRDILLYARGNMGRQRTADYSRFLRQRLIKLSRDHKWDERHRVYIIQATDDLPGYDEAQLRSLYPDISAYSHQLSRAVFCAVLPGDGFSARFEDAVLHGCLPVIIQDHVHVPFESILDVDSFSLRISEAAINEDLPKVLEAISAEQIERMQRRLGAVWHRFAYVSGSFMRRSFAKTAAGNARTVARSASDVAVSPPGHPFPTLRRFPERDDAFHTILQWLHWRIPFTR